MSFPYLGIVLKRTDSGNKPLGKGEKMIGWLSFPGLIAGQRALVHMRRTKAGFWTLERRE